MNKNGLDYSRFLRLCGCHESYGEKKEINQWILQYLNQSFFATVLYFKRRIEKAVQDLRERPLRDYGKSLAFKTAWQLANTPSPFTNYNFLSFIDPEKTGILCGTDRDNAILLTEESLGPLGLFDKPSWGENIYKLSQSLAWWRMAVCCVWAGKIVNNLVSYLFAKKQKLFLPPADNPVILQQDLTQQEEISVEEPLGKILVFDSLTDEEADELYNLYEKASFGSGACESSTAEAFKNWLRYTNIGVLQDCGLTPDEADILFLAGSQQMPEIDIDLCWCQGIKVIYTHILHFSG